VKRSYVIILVLAVLLDVVIALWYFGFFESQEVAPNDAAVPQFRALSLPRAADSASPSPTEKF
jgi:hypothetical protein